MQMSTVHAHRLMTRNARGPGLAYHDPTYDESGGQGTAVQTFDPNAQVQNPGVLLLIVAVIAFIYLLGEE